MTASNAEPDPTNLAIASAVTQLRENHDLTVEQLAVYTGLNRTQLYKKLKGEAGWKATDVAALARYFAVQPNDLFSGQPLIARRRRPLRPAAIPSHTSAGHTHGYVSHRRSRSVYATVIPFPRSA